MLNFPSLITIKWASIDVSNSSENVRVPSTKTYINLGVLTSTIKVYPALTITESPFPGYSYPPQVLISDHLVA